MTGNPTAPERVYIVIVNWNGWQDTVECLESVLRLDYPDFRVVVCDNGSDDGSAQHIRQWAEGKLRVELTENRPISPLAHPAVPKPISLAEYDRDTAEKGGKPDAGDARLVVIRTGGNLGFAGGTNVGLRYALARGDCDYAWLLNNDTVVEPNALTSMVERMTAQADVGICGSTILNYEQPDRVQALGGGVYSSWLGLARHIGEGSRAAMPIDCTSIERRMDYVVGASMLVSKGFLRDVGLMCEDYFLYYEEVDWKLRARGRYSLAYSPQSVIYHKEGKATGANNQAGSTKSVQSDYYLVRARLALTRRFHPRALPTVYLGLLITFARRLGQKHRWQRARTFWAAAFGRENGNSYK